MDIADSGSIETEDIPSETLYQFIRELPEGYRTVFNLYVIDNKSHKEIASLLGIRRIHLPRNCTKLRQCWYRK